MKTCLISLKIKYMQMNITQILKDYMSPTKLAKIQKLSKHFC